MQLAIIFSLLLFANIFVRTVLTDLLDKIMSIIVSNCQHCGEQEFQNTAMCTLHDYLSSKVRFIHTSTVTGSNSCYAYYAYASCTSC